MNRINKLFNDKKKDILSVYFTAGFPSLNDTVEIISELDKAGVDMIEIGIPFSDPVADGPVIQRSNGKSIQNGMSLQVLFGQLKNIREITDMPLLLMGYFNPILRFDVEKFAEQCQKTGIDGAIIPDLPVEEFTGHYAKIFDNNGLLNIFFITPQSTEERIRYLDKISKGFLYVISSPALTGIRKDFSQSRNEYFKRIAGMNLVTPTLTGFGISDKETFRQACNYTNGAITGSAFIQGMEKSGSIRESIQGLLDLIY